MVSEAARSVSRPRPFLAASLIHPVGTLEVLSHVFSPQWHHGGAVPAARPAVGQGPAAPAQEPHPDAHLPPAPDPAPDPAPAGVPPRPRREGPGGHGRQGRAAGLRLAAGARQRPGPGPGGPAPLLRGLPVPGLGGAEGAAPDLLRRLPHPGRLERGAQRLPAARQADLALPLRRRLGPGAQEGHGQGGSGFRAGL